MAADLDKKKMVVADRVSWSGFDSVKAIKEYLGSENVSKLYNSIFSNVCKIQKIKTPGKLLFDLFSCLVDVNKADVLVFDIRGQREEFTTAEFERVSGFKTDLLVSFPSELDEAPGRLLNQYFSGAKVTRGELKKFFTSSRFDDLKSTDDGLKLCLGYMYFSSVLGRTKLLPFYIYNVLDDDQLCQSFPWGKVVFEYLVDEFNSAAVKSRNPPAHFFVNGFIHVLFCWLMDKYPCLRDIATRVGNDDDLVMLQWVVHGNKSLDTLLKLYDNSCVKTLPLVPCIPDEENSDGDFVVDSVRPLNKRSSMLKRKCSSKLDKVDTVSVKRLRVAEGSAKKSDKLPQIDFSKFASVDQLKAVEMKMDNMFEAVFQKLNDMGSKVDACCERQKVILNVVETTKNDSEFSKFELMSFKSSFNSFEQKYDKDVSEISNVVKGFISYMSSANVNKNNSDDMDVARGSGSFHCEPPVGEHQSAGKDVNDNLHSIVPFKEPSLDLSQETHLVDSALKSVLADLKSSEEADVENVSVSAVDSFTSSDFRVMDNLVEQHVAAVHSSVEKNKAVVDDSLAVVDDSLAIVNVDINAADVGLQLNPQNAVRTIKLKFSRIFVLEDVEDIDEEGQFAEVFSLDDAIASALLRGDESLGLPNFNLLSQNTFDSDQGAKIQITRKHLLSPYVHEQMVKQNIPRRVVMLSYKFQSRCIFHYSNKENVKNFISFLKQDLIKLDNDPKKCYRPGKENIDCALRVYNHEVRQKIYFLEWASSKFTLTDDHVDDGFFFLRKFSLYHEDVVNGKVFTSTDVVFDNYFLSSFDAYTKMSAEERNSFDIEDYLFNSIHGIERLCGVSWAAADYIFFPCRVQNENNAVCTHYFLLIFKVSDNTLILLNSLKKGSGFNKKVMKHANVYVSFLPKILKMIRFKAISLRGYKENYTRPKLVSLECTKQANDVDCGAFILKYAEQFMLHKRCDLFAEAEICRFRRDFGVNIWCHGLWQLKYGLLTPDESVETTYVYMDEFHHKCPSRLPIYFTDSPFSMKNSLRPRN